MRGPESRLGKRIIKSLKEEWPSGYFRKIHGNAFQNIGIPDWLCCVEGVFFGLEIKRPGRRATEAQLLEISLIQKAKGFASVVYSPEEAVEFVKKSLKIFIGRKHGIEEKRTFSQDFFVQSKTSKKEQEEGNQLG